MIAAALVALLAALFFAIGSVAQQRAASQVDTAEASGLSLIWILVRRPLWWAGSRVPILGRNIEPRR